MCNQFHLFAIIPSNDVSYANVSPLFNVSNVKWNKSTFLNDEKKNEFETNINRKLSQVQL